MSNIKLYQIIVDGKTILHCYSAAKKNRVWATASVGAELWVDGKKVNTIRAQEAQ